MTKAVLGVHRNSGIAKNFPHVDTRLVVGVHEVPADAHELLLRPAEYASYRCRDERSGPVSSVNRHDVHRAFLKCLQAIALLLPLHLERHVLEADRDVLDGAPGVDEGKKREFDAYATPNGDVDMDDIARVVPKRRDGHGFTVEGAPDELSNSLRGALLVLENVVFGRGLGSEEGAERVVHEQTLSIRAINLESDRRVHEQALEEGPWIFDRRKTAGDSWFRHVASTVAEPRRRFRLRLLPRSARRAFPRVA